MQVPESGATSSRTRPFRVGCVRQPRSCYLKAKAGCHSIKNLPYGLLSDIVKPQASIIRDIPPTWMRSALSFNLTNQYNQQGVRILLAAAFALTVAALVEHTLDRIYITPAE
jgi:hypothetical protein